MNLKLKIFKDKLSSPQIKKEKQTTKSSSTDLDPKIDVVQESNGDQIPQPVGKNVPQFMSLSKLEFDKFDVRAGLIKDPTAKGGIRYQIIEPALSVRDEQALEIIKKLLMTELSVSMGEIK